MLTTADPELGISVRYRNVHELKGVYVSPSGSSLTLSVDVSSLYVDGSPIAFTGAKVDLPAGRHQWELTVRKPEPLPPEIVRAEHFAGGATVHLDAVPAAEYYEIQLSRDGGVAWEVAATTSDDFFVLTSLTEKVHVRAVACNTDQRSAPGREYPIYPTAQPPPPPDGLRLRLGRGVVTATWGEVLGATSYRLYRRRAGTTDYEEIFRGLAHQYVDESANGVVEAYSDPGDGPEVSTYEYAVAAENGNGVGARSTPIDTDPRSCRNWRPPGGITFRPQHTYNQLPYFPLREGS
jgi:hypothetical protein